MAKKSSGIRSGLAMEKSLTVWMSLLICGSVKSIDNQSEREGIVGIVSLLKFDQVWKLCHRRSSV